jgi:hypothetical protein
MADPEGIEARLKLLERAVSTVLQLGARDRYEIQALKAALAAVIDINRPDDADTANRWFDAMLEVALRNAGLVAELAADAIIRDHGPDAEMLAATEEERQAVTKLIANLFAALKRPHGLTQG